MTRTDLLKSMRLTHHYFGVFIAPAVLFFSFTGFIQTYSLHETTRGRSYVPPAILVHLGQLHKKATLTVPVRKPPADSSSKGNQPAPVKTPQPPSQPLPPSHMPMKIFFGVVAVGLFTSTLTGLWMAWSYNRSKPLVAGTFLAGLVIPLLLLLF